jgi:S-adenosylmethionine:tRNA ribosyltransferase-isomerase
VTDAFSLDLFDYKLPRDRIAQYPVAERDAARLLVLHRAGGAPRHSQVCELSRWLRPGDLLVGNASWVRPARLRGRKASGGRAEALILGLLPDSPGRYRALVRCGGRLREGQKLHFGATDAETIDAEVTALGEGGEVTLTFAPDVSPYAVGEMPLPPYIRREQPDPLDRGRYQTVFACEPGSVAAPTAGLHLTGRLLGDLRARGISWAEVILHVGPGTFRPLRAKDLAAGRLHSECFELPEVTAEAVARTRAAGGRIVAVGTTTTRVLETCADEHGRVQPARSQTDLFVRPGYRFRVVDALLTNFHLPRSSLLLLVAAFAGRERILAAYAEAIEEGYRFYSYGDAMLIL